MRAHLVALLSLSVVACSSSSTTPPTPGAGGEGAAWRSGSRVKTRVLRAEGGAAIFDAMFDTTLGAVCTLSTTSDGTVRCVPSDASVAFSDAACSQPIFVAANDCATPKFAIARQESDSCATPFASVLVYEIGAKLTTKPTQIFSRSGTSCYPGSGPIGEVHAVTVVEPARFVAYQKTEEKRGPLLAHAWVGEDGSRRIMDWSIAETKVTCSFEASAQLERGATVSCIPTPLAYVMDSGGEYEDATCTKDAAYAYGKCDAPRVVNKYSKTADACDPYRVELIAVGAPLGKAYSKQTGTCAEATMSPGADPKRFFALGAPLDLSKYPSATRIQQGTGRLQSRALKLDDLVIEPHYGSFTIAATAQGCNLSKLPDGKLHCIPSDTSVTLSPTSQANYADAACTKRIVPGPANTACTKSPTVILTASAATSCGAQTIEKVNAVGPRVTQASYYYQDVGQTNCQEAPMRADDAYYEFGAEQTPDFPVVTQEDG